ncbi:MAG: T9SS type A sorting domain-containing protein [Saprospiraceae bacterium]|nr:T9SS type A sorting domain-containing protein [Saprospiraceae bacterium]
MHASSVTIHAQDIVFAPIGATWSYSSSSFGPPWLSDPLYMQFIVERDTLMSGYDARVIRCYVNENNQMVRVDSLTKYVATIGEQVYYFVENEFVLLYDFGSQPGDTIHSRVEKFALNIGCDSDFSNGDIEFSYVIDSLWLQSIDGEDLRVLNVHSLSHSPEPDWFFWEPILERIGPISYGGLWWGKGEYCIPESGFLRCYVDQEITWRSPYFNDNLPCDYISSSTEIQSSSYIIHPNPAMTQVYLPEGSVQVELFDITGQRLFVENSGIEIDVSAYPPGMYFIRFNLDGELMVSSFVKM